MLEWGAGSVQRLVKYMSMRSWQKRSPLFVWHEIKQEKCSRCPMLQHCGQRHKALLCSRTRFSIETHLFQLSQPTYGWWYLLWNSCSSYSYRNNGIFLTDPEIWMSERGWKSSILLQWCHLNYVCISVYACVCVFIFMGKQEMGEKKHTSPVFLMNLCPKAALCLSFTRTFVRLNHQTVCGLETWFSRKETP